MKIRPIIKWTGGKYSEFALFNQFIPSFDRYIEPFFGGGGVFFALQPKTPVFINDKSADLIDFYRAMANDQLKVEMLNYADAWDELGEICDKIWEEYSSAYISYIKNENEKLKDSVLSSLKLAIKSSKLFTETDFLIEKSLFLPKLIASVADKARRIKRITVNENRVFSSSELKSHFETGVKSGTYLFFRSILNKYYKRQLKLDVIKAAANWYFVREFCYGSMFRFNRRGEFNIPYGGIAYNRKKFRKKINHIFSDKIRSLFKDVAISNNDFELFLTQVSPLSSDFIFVDPPYDSEFSEYDQNSFTHEDQKRLARFLFGTEAKWMVVIKETPFIRDLYQRKGVKINTFSKNYRYNVRGRNNRNVEHLIITNY